MKVLLADDDKVLTHLLSSGLRAKGVETVVAHDAMQAFMSALRSPPDVIVLDVQMPGLSGLDLQRQLADGRRALPIVFMTGHGDIPMTVEAMKAGAVGFLPKPFRNQDLIDAVKEGLNRDREARTKLAEENDLRKRYDSLTAREREVFALVTAGSLNKQIAHQLGTSERTIKAHRAQVVLKMQADSVADLVRMADKLGIGVGQH